MINIVWGCSSLLLEGLNERGSKGIKKEVLQAPGVEHEEIQLSARTERNRKRSTYPFSRFSEASATFLMCSGRLSNSVHFDGSAGEGLNPNLVAITTCSRKGARASPTSSSFVNGP
jgi:hypothetical protein